MTGYRHRGVSNHRQVHCLPKNSLRLTTKKTLFFIPDPFIELSHFTRYSDKTFKSQKRDTGRCHYNAANFRQGSHSWHDVVPCEGEINWMSFVSSKSDEWSTFVLLCVVWDMMTSSNGNIFRVTGHFCGEFTGHRWIPRTKASDAELWCFLWSVPE